MNGGVVVLLTMMMTVRPPLKIYIAGGATSNLFVTSVLPLLLKNEDAIFATVREPTRPIAIELQQRHSVTLVCADDAKNTSFDRVLWFSTHDDIEMLTRFSSTTPTLAISSAAVMDYHRGVLSKDQLNAYQKSKLLLGRIPNIYTLIPGFYIDDVSMPGANVSKGLHGDSTVKIFNDGDTYTGDDFDWGKSYSVTPKSLLAAAIVKWIDTPSIIKPNTPVIACSDRVWSRGDLRRLVYGTIVKQGKKNWNVVASPEPIYKSFDHIMHITDDDVGWACVAAAQIVRGW